MNILQPWQLLLVALAGWINRQQQDVIEYLQEENRVLRSKLKGKRIRFTADERRRLAVKGKLLGRKILGDVASIVTPDTILRWHRMLITQKYDGSSRRGPGRPRVKDEIAKLAVRMANENPRWGYTTIRGALFHVGHDIARETVRKILKEHGIVPAPERRTFNLNLPCLDTSSPRQPSTSTEFALGIRRRRRGVRKYPSRGKTKDFQAFRQAPNLAC